MQQDIFSFNRSENSPPGEKLDSQAKVFSVTQVTQGISDLLEGSFADLWISGEVTNFRNRTGRHWYFALKDEKSQIGSVIFNAASRRFNFALEDGLEVICHGKLNLYAPRGTYSLIIDHIEPKGVGALQLAFEQLKKSLKAEGLFDKKHKKPLPYLPKKIGVVTSATGAALRDIIHVLTRRFPGINILLSPAKVQGAGSAEEIAAAIALLNERKDVDMMIVGRGGGSLEDLWAFNEEVTARAIFASRIPVISAVGHEIDYTIADFVADVRAPTPSVAAEIAVPVKTDLQLTIAERKNQLSFALRKLVENKAQTVGQLRARLKDPRSRFPDLLLRVDGCKERLFNAVEASLQVRRQHMAKLLSNLDHLSPLNVLAKGYAVVQKTAQKTSVKNASTLKVGEKLNITLSKGSAEAKVISVDTKS